MENIISNSSFDDDDSKEETILAQVLIGMIQNYTKTRGDELANRQKELNDLKREIARHSKENFVLELDIRKMDNKIALLVKNRLSLDDVCFKSLRDSRNSPVNMKQNKLENYGKLFYILQSDTNYVARLCDKAKMSDIDNLLQIVMFNLYVNQYDQYEEYLLLNMFQKVLEFEFSSAKHFSTILRGNSALTRMVTTYTKRSPGEKYLKSVLSKALAHVINSPFSLEIEPNRLKEELILEAEKEGKKSKYKDIGEDVIFEELEEIKEILEKRYRKYGEFIDQFIDHLVASIDEIPQGIRWICKQIYLLVKKYFPDNSKLNSTSIIGGFFILRFIGPGIVTPLSISPSLNDKSVRRNLTYKIKKQLAKIVQNITNNVMFKEEKAKYMYSLNYIIEKHRERLHDFLFQLTKVPDLPQINKTMEPNTNRSINITPNEIYFIHSLLASNRNEIFGEGDEEIKILLDDLGDVPQNNRSTSESPIDLQLIRSISNSDEYLIDQVYIESKYLLFYTLNLIPIELINSEITILKSIEIAKKYVENKDFVALEKIEKLLANIQILSKNNIIYLQDDFANLKRDISIDINNHDNMLRKSNKEQITLMEIRENLLEREKDLQNQIDYFNVYLENIQNHGTIRKKENDKKERVKKAAKYTHGALMREGVLLDSSIPEDRRQTINFTITRAEVGAFDLTMYFGKRNIGKLTFKLDELLERREDDDLIFQNDILKIDVNNLIRLLNKEFIVE